MPRLSSPSRSSRRVALLAALLCACACAAAAAPAGASAAQLVVTGGGSGHGVGMSQWGAQGWAQHGKGWHWILKRYYRGTKVGRLGRTRPVRVLLNTTGAVTISGAARAGSRTLRPSTAYRAAVDGDAIALHAGGRTVRVAPGTRLTAPRPPLRIAGFGAYRGAIVLKIAPGGDLRVVNEVAVEEYLRGVVPSEVYAGSWKTDALKAQAVAARTYAVASYRDATSDFDVVDTTGSQVYSGIGREHPRTDAAIRATRGLVVTWRRRPIVAYFHASSGGRTENVEIGITGAAPQPYLVGVADPWDRSPDRTWRKAFPLAKAERLLAGAGLLSGALTEIRPLVVGASGRVATAEVLGSGGTTAVTGEQLKQALGLNDTLARYAIVP